MSFVSPRRHRPSRTTTLHLPPNLAARSWETLRRTDVLLRLGVFFVAAVLLWLITGAGMPPFAFRTGDVPQRKIIARVDFRLRDDVETEKRKQEARRLAEAVYENNARLLEEVRQDLTNKVSRLVQAESFDKVDQKLWTEFSPPLMSRSADEERNCPQDPFPVGLHDLVKRTVIAAPSPLNEFEVNQHGRRHRSQCYRP